MLDQRIVTTRLQITHDTHYAYSSDVFLEPHVLRFGLRPASYLHVEQYSLSVAAEPAGRREMRDEENNAITFCYFSGLVDSLHVRAQTTVATYAYNPLGFILYPSTFGRMRFAYSTVQRVQLAHYLTALEVGDALKTFGASTLAEVANDTVQYLTQLTYQINARFDVVFREWGAPRDPDETFALASGSCRDLSWMMIALLRSQGVAARFVSGYLYFEMEGEPAYELHAWVEVFLPGSGWFGLDPSQGLLAGHTHLPICASALAEATMPVTGGFRGEATATLSTELTIVPL